MARRVLAIALLAALALGFLFWAHAYLVQRLVFDVGFPSALEPWLVGMVAVFASTLLLQPAGERLLPHRRARWIAWPASLWMGAGFLLLIAVSASDVAYWVVGAEGLGAARTRAALVVGGVAWLFVISLREGLRPPRLSRIEVATPRWPRALDGFRIVQISDIHIGPLLDRRFARDLVDRINALEPDLIAVTGDLVDGSVKYLEPEVAPFGDLRARHGVFFVTGNHDHYSDATRWVEHVQKLGMTVLRNDWRRIDVERHGGRASFAIAGVDDHRAKLIPGEPGEDLERALGAVPDDLPVLLLAHDPSTFKKACAYDIELQISGHTHGGQIWPFDLMVRAVIPFVAGRYERNGSQLYVSRGTGFWGPPLRLAAPAELTELVMRREGADD